MASDAIDPAIEAEYSLRPRHPEREAVYAAMREAGQALRAAHAATMDLRYGDGPRMCLDYYPAGANAPLFVFVHGGYWRALDKETFAFLALPLLARGIAVAMPGYDLAPKFAVPQIEAEIDAALVWLADNAARLGFDAGRVVLSGHSAGAQLTAMAALRGRHGLGLKGLIGISGVYDLAPLLKTSIGPSIGLTVEQARAASPALSIKTPPVLPARFVVGAQETEGFLAQTRNFAKVWRASGGNAEQVEVSGTNHFTVIDGAFTSETFAAIEGWLRLEKTR